MDYYYDERRASTIQNEPLLSRRSIRLVVLGTALLGLGAAAAMWISGAEEAEEEPATVPPQRVTKASGTTASSARGSASMPPPDKVETYDDAPDLD